MHGWYEVFDNEKVRFVTRTQATHIGVLAMTLLGATLAAAAVVLEGLADGWAMLALVATAWAAGLTWTAHRLRVLRRVVWCVKIGDRHVIGYAYNRKRIRLDWITIERIELAPKGLCICGAGDVRLEIPHLFPDFALLSHSLIRHAEFYETPVTVDGTPWQEIDVYAVFSGVLDPAEPPEPLN